MGYYVRWEAIWHPGVDWLMPGQGDGQRLCLSLDTAKAFRAKLLREGVQIGKDAAEILFADELKITIVPERAKRVTDHSGRPRRAKARR